MIAVDGGRFRVLPNPNNRFLINSQSKLQYGADGSLTLYFADQKPADAPDGNWLPTPKGTKYRLTFRFYRPTEGVANGTYYPAAADKAVTRRRRNHGTTFGHSQPHTPHSPNRRTFAKWGLGLFIFGVFLTFGVIAHYCVGAGCRMVSFPAEHLAVVGLPMDLLGRRGAGRRARHGGDRFHFDGRGGRIPQAPRRPRDMPQRSGFASQACSAYFRTWLSGLLRLRCGCWPSFYYSPIAAGKNLLARAGVFHRVYFAGIVLAFSGVRRAPDTLPERA